ncbi:MAG: FtsQ-type POTRA domain-containing protein [Thermoleophilia bacterium]|jgi:cell division septal protein FtsQ
METNGRNIRKNLWLVLLGLLSAGIVAGAFFWLSQSEVLAIDDIVIDGNRVVSTDEIMDRTGPMLRGKSLLSISFDNASRSLSELSYVESVELDRDFPHTMTIHVREYRPFVTLAGEEGKFYMLASDGRVLEAPSAPDPNFPLLSTKEPCPAQIGGQVDCADALAGFEFMNNIPTNFNQDIAEVRVVDGDVIMRTRSGVNINFGALTDYGLKFEVLRQLLARSTSAGTTLTIDVSVVERPVTKDGNAVAPPTTVTTQTQTTGG